MTRMMPIEEAQDVRSDLPQQGKIADNSLKDDVSSASNGWQEVTRRSLEAGRMLAFLFRSVWPILGEGPHF